MEFNQLSILFLVSVLIACQPSPQKIETHISTSPEHISGLLDRWHDAATQADADAYFGFMDPDCIFLGTDKTERWSRDELRTWSAAAFERDTAWAFTKTERHILLAEDGKTAWFDELLDTWMGPCRGSGVLVYYSTGWKMKQYNLAMLIDNEDVDAVLELTQVLNAQPDSLLKSQ